MVKKTFRCAAAAATAAGAMAISGSAAAAIIYTFDVTGTSGGQPVSGTAVITVTGSSYTVVLTDTQANPKAASQEISGLQITFAAPTPGSPILASQSGSLIDIGKGGAVTPVAGNPTNWSLTGAGNLTTLTGLKDELIIGPGPYTNANGGISAHNPQIQNTGTFVIDFTSATKPGAITGVNFGFGLGNKFLSGTLVSVTGAIPEPATWAMLLLGIGAVGAGLRMRRAMTPVTA